jgi:hypothetical protein
MTLSAAITRRASNLSGMTPRRPPMITGAV